MAIPKLLTLTHLRGGGAHFRARSNRAYKFIGHGRRIQSRVITRIAWLPVQLLCLALLAALSGCGGAADVSQPTPPHGPPTLALTAFVSGLTSPIGMEIPNDSSGRLFVLEQAGRIRIIQSGALLATPFLDITSKVASGGETGLLGLAFHPSFSTNRRFFIYYTRRVSGQFQSVFSEYAASASDPNQADAASERILLVVNQPFDNHNGGQLAFGPDGFLYIAVGDGGSGGDPQGNGQNTGALLGKILRIDVDSAFAPASSTPFRRTILLPPAAACPRYGLTACAIPGAFLLTALPAGCSPATSARTISKKWTSSPKAATSAGARWKAPTAIRRAARAARPG
jgi:hypothetical protein